MAAGVVTLRSDGDGELGITLAGKVALATEIVAAYGRVRVGLRRRDLPAVVRDARAARRTRGRRALAAGDQQRLARAVVRVLDPLPAGSRCLTRALVLLRVLGRRGTNGSLVIAVRPGEDPGLAAHAWVEVDGEPLLPPAPDYGRLVSL